MLGKGNKGEGDKCGCCQTERLVVRRGALVCPHCDNLKDWPKER